SGLGPNFSTFNDGGLWNVNTNSSGLELSKPADPGTYLPSGWVTAGARSGFVLNGDFKVTVDFTLPDLPFTSGGEMLNESILWAGSQDNGAYFEILRYGEGSQQLIESFGSSGLVGVADSSITSGSYQLTRSGSTLTALYAPEGSSSFINLGSYTDAS